MPKYYIFLLLCCASLLAKAQTDMPVFRHRSSSPSVSAAPQSNNAPEIGLKSTSPLRKLYYGGSFGLDFSNGWLLEVSPLAGYKIGNGVSLGANASFRYLSAVLLSKYGQAYNATNFTGSMGVFGRKKLNTNFFLQAEAAMVLYDMPMYDGQLVRLNAENKATAERVWQPALPLGFGFTSGDRTSFNLIALYDVLYQDGTPKPSGWTLRIGFEHGF